MRLLVSGAGSEAANGFYNATSEYAGFPLYTQESPCCASCRGSLQQSTYNEGPYNGDGWACNECGCAGDAGDARWLCAQCCNDWCFECRPALPMEIWQNYSQWRLGRTNNYYYISPLPQEAPEYIDNLAAAPPASGWIVAGEFDGYERLANKSACNPPPTIDCVSAQHSSNTGARGGGGAAPPAAASQLFMTGGDPLFDSGAGAELINSSSGGGDGRFEDAAFPRGAEAIALCSASTRGRDPDAGETADYEDLAAGRRGYEGVEWRRPLASEQLFHVPPPFVRQRNVGNCWLVSAMTAACSSCPAEASQAVRWDRARGCFSVRVMLDGHPAWILCDDYLPVGRQTGQPVFATSCHPSSCSVSSSSSQSSHPADHSAGGLWAAFVEKAFAKWAGAYQGLRGGLQNVVTPIGSGRAMRGLLPDRPFSDVDNLYLSNKDAWGGFEAVQQHLSSTGLVTASGADGQSGLSRGHVYTVLDAFTATPIEVLRGQQQQQQQQPTELHSGAVSLRNPSSSFLNVCPETNKQRASR
jgi:hypothetical protein